MNEYKMGNIVLGRSYDEYYGRWSEWEKAEFLKEDEDLEYGRYVCLTWTHDGKVVDCFDEIKPCNEQGANMKDKIIECYTDSRDINEHFEEDMDIQDFIEKIYNF